MFGYASYCGKDNLPVVFNVIDDERTIVYDFTESCNLLNVLETQAKSLSEDHTFINNQSSADLNTIIYSSYRERVSTSCHHDREGPKLGQRCPDISYQKINEPTSIWKTFVMANLGERNEIVALSSVLEVIWELCEVSLSREGSWDDFFKDTALVEGLAVLQEKFQELFRRDFWIRTFKERLLLLGFLLTALLLF